MEAIAMESKPEKTTGRETNGRTCKCAAGITRQKHRSKDVDSNLNAAPVQDQPDEIDPDWIWTRSQPLRKQQDCTQYAGGHDPNAAPMQDQPDEIDPDWIWTRSQPLQKQKEFTQRQGGQETDFVSQRHICCPPPLENQEYNFGPTQLQLDEIDPLLLNPQNFSQSIQKRELSDRPNVSFSPAPPSDDTPLFDCSGATNDRVKCTRPYCLDP